MTLQLGQYLELRDTLSAAWSVTLSIGSLQCTAHIETVETLRHATTHPETVAGQLEKKKDALQGEASGSGRLKPKHEPLHQGALTSASWSTARTSALNKRTLP